MVDSAGGRLAETDDLVVPALGDSVLAVRAVVAMCSLSARGHDGVADLSGAPVVVDAEPSDAGPPRLRVRLGIVAAYGADLHTLADDVRRGITTTLTGMTGLEVVGVDVAVTDVALPD
ncbi:Asp23/Gls24 family envelope stress response protein [Nocardioides sp. CFH 31398]|uniref:Asp23/Gls24 family envelope stress response protein n=1 Tax=Nocardioides sp. CFH 31398 TaxID=2919579 RepID=UPI001F0565FA|nr:Asp23/Gls24 family envelope stress response protein [Nocardioides sp. CFH 31398]MCH1866910.1 Asp23/Gls24 family envelope stress response protein [Nocardioides sp. CFH 31398]